MISNDSKFIYIQTDQSLKDFCIELKNHQWIAFDTEFMREKTYFPQLCLLQVATPNLIACIDPLACTDLSPLLEILFNQKILKVLHAASQDLEVLFRLRNSVPTPIFDTQIAATVLGQRSNIGYAELIQKVLGVTLAKSHTRADWSLRPLSEPQLQYAADDVRYLVQLFQIQKEQLTKTNRWEWIERDLTLLTNPGKYELNFDEAWLRIKDAIRLRGAKLAILRRLAAWREQRAINVNRPRRWIMSDEIAVELAENSMKSTHSVSTILNKEKGLQRFIKEISEIIEQARLEQRETWPVFPQSPVLNRSQQTIVKQLLSCVEHRAKELDVLPHILATKKDVIAFVQGERNLFILQGWRENVIGRDLILLLEKHLANSEC